LNNRIYTRYVGQPSVHRFGISGVFNDLYRAMIFTEFAHILSKMHPSKIVKNELM